MNRCALFESISAEVWTEITQQRITGPEPIETGFTSRIISNIRNAYANDNNIGLWANNAYNESKYGSDIDIFIEMEEDQFVWYAMQAKVMKISGIYESMCHSHPPQWVKLFNLHKSLGCLPYYLLYNGDSNFYHFGFDNCSKAFDESQFGCSIVDLRTIARASIGENKNCQPPNFNQLHPHYAQPWRILTCCIPPQSAKRFPLNQIKNYTKPYELITINTPEGFEQEELVEEFYNADGQGANAISNAATSVGRTPEYIMLFRHLRHN